VSRDPRTTRRRWLPRLARSAEAVVPSCRPPPVSAVSIGCTALRRSAATPPRGASPAVRQTGPKGERWAAIGPDPAELNRVLWTGIDQVRRAARPAEQVGQPARREWAVVATHHDRQRVSVAELSKCRAGTVGHRYGGVDRGLIRRRVAYRCSEGCWRRSAWFGVIGTFQATGAVAAGTPVVQLRDVS
jgi:hypothetical protein